VLHNALMPSGTRHALSQNEACELFFLRDTFVRSACRPAISLPTGVFPSRSRSNMLPIGEGHTKAQC